MLRHHLEHGPAVELAHALVVVGHHRLLFAIADGQQSAGVDAVVNVSDIEKVGRMVWQGRAEKKAFYRRYLDALENLVIT